MTVVLLLSLWSHPFPSPSAVRPSVRPSARPTIRPSVENRSSARSVVWYLSKVVTVAKSVCKVRIELLYEFFKC